MQLKAIVFDYGKVLTVPPTPEDWARLASAFGVSAEQLQAPYWSLREDYDRAVYTGPSYWQTAAKQLGKTVAEEDIPRQIELDNTQWTHIHPEMLDFAWRAQEAGLKIGILSNMQGNMLAAMRRKLPWLDRFDAQVYSCEIGAIKPEPAAYHAVLRALGVKPGESLFFDDKQPNIDGARAVGMHAVLFEGNVDTAYTALDRLGFPLPERKAAD